MLGHQPLVIVDGAHNPAGADVLRAGRSPTTSRPAGRRDPGGRRAPRGRDPAEMLEAFRADDARLVVCCTPPSPRAVPAAEVAAGPRAIGCDEVLVDWTWRKRATWRWTWPSPTTPCW